MANITLDTNKLGGALANQLRSLGINPVSADVLGQAVVNQLRQAGVVAEEAGSPFVSYTPAQAPKPAISTRGLEAAAAAFQKELQGVIAQYEEFYGSSPVGAIAILDGTGILGTGIRA